jgi:hypothetical protein
MLRCTKLPVEIRSESALVIAKFWFERSAYDNRTAFPNANEGPPIFTVLGVRDGALCGSIVCLS